MGWRGVKSHLPSKGMNLWPSRRKATKTGILDDDKNHSGYFSAGSGAATPVISPIDGQLDKLFDGLRDDESDPKDKLGLDSTMRYLTEDLKVNLENAEFLVAMEVVQAPGVGEVSRKGYVDGWKATGAPATKQGHSAYVKTMIKSLSSDPAYFRKVYRHTFVAGKESDQKALALENALIYWTTLFSPPGWTWATKSHNWLELWTTFLTEKWTRSVNRDMWNMTLEFATKSVADETLSFWSEDGAWPSVIDDFVAWCRAKGIGKAETMDVDE